MTVSSMARLGTASLNMYMASLGAWVGAGGWSLFQKLLTSLKTPLLINLSNPSFLREVCCRRWARAAGRCFRSC